MDRVTETEIKADSDVIHLLTDARSEILEAIQRVNDLARAEANAR